MYTVLQSAKKTGIPIRELYNLLETYKLKVNIFYHMGKKVFHLDDIDIERVKALYRKDKPNELDKQNN